MAKINIIPAIVFAPFEMALGKHWDKVCNDCKSFLGRLEKDIVTTGGDWKVTNTGKLKSKDGNEVALPLNNPMSVLLRFGMQLTEIASNGNFGGAYKLNKDGNAVESIGIQAELPKECQAWFDTMNKEEKELVTT